MTLVCQSSNLCAFSEWKKFKNQVEILKTKAKKNEKNKLVVIRESISSN